jgi:hypothetical protein
LDALSALWVHLREGGYARAILKTINNRGRVSERDVDKGRKRESERKREQERERKRERKRGKEKERERKRKKETMTECGESSLSLSPPASLPASAPYWLSSNGGTVSNRSYDGDVDGDGYRNGDDYGDGDCDGDNDDDDGDGVDLVAFRRLRYAAAR